MLQNRKQLGKSIKLLLLGAGELGKEFVMAAQRLGLTVIAVDRYEGAPAMQVADRRHVVDMLNGDELEKLIKAEAPDYIIPEIEAIRTSKLVDLEKQGFTVIPSSRAVNLTMNRDAIRDLAAHELRLKTAAYEYTDNLDDLKKVVSRIGFPCVIKPIMSSSGKGQSVVRKTSEVETAWQYALDGMRGDQKKVIVEEFIHFESEITLLTIKPVKGKTLFCPPIGHRQERGDYQESWMPAKMNPRLLKKAQAMAKKVTDALGGAGLFGVEFFLTKNDIYFSELSPRPHDTGLVTLASQNINEFELHLRAILGLPIAKIENVSPAASSVILARDSFVNPSFTGVDKALALKDVDVRLFGKPDTRPYRRMGVALARAKSTTAARKLATRAAAMVKVVRTS